MSTQYWSVSGIGLEITNVTAEKIIEFVRNHSKNEQILNDFSKLSWCELEDIYMDYNYNSDYGVRSILAEIISKETNLHISYNADCDDNREYLLYIQKYPWQMSEEDFKLTSDTSLKDILEPYRKELGLGLNNFDYYEVHYFG